MNTEVPVYRKLRVFAFDPGTTAKLDQTMINEVTLKIPWEKLDEGPVGEYVEVIDEDEQGHRLNYPIDLDDPYILAGNGLTPSDGNPLFHQQMVYAVAMRTIAAFEKALGRKAHWPSVNGAYTPRIKFFPHYMEEPNAYYDPNTGGIFLGYFKAPENTQYPGMFVFTCLSQDIIAHELSHVLVNGTRMYWHFMRVSATWSLCYSISLYRMLSATKLPITEESSQEKKTC
jgi:hypothetical protein